MEDSEGTVRQIGAFSEGINNLTVRRKTGVCRIRFLFCTMDLRPLPVSSIK